MLLLAVLSVASVAVVGLIVKWVLEVRGAAARITWREYAIGMAISPVLALVVVWAGWFIARQNLITFTEYWNGWEVSAVKQEIACTRDGPCYWEYDCDPYRCRPHNCNCMCVSRDKKGSCTSQRCDTCYDTCYHDCPYVTHEYDYSVSSTIGPFSIAENIFPPNPDSHRWRSGRQVPNSIIQRAGVGDPLFWVQVKKRCEADQPGPVTKRNDYPNYILASDHTLMKEHSSDVADYRSRNLLPPLVQSIGAFYHADKVSFVGWQPPDRSIWNQALEYLNANFGRELQGDLFLVIVKDDAVAENPERYILALKAFWQNKEVFGTGSLAKNAVVIVLGTADGSTVSWSRGFTGMPLGNEKFIVVTRDGLKGLSLTPDTLIGPIRSNYEKHGVRYPPDGEPRVIHRLLWGMDDPETKFKRVSMSGKDGQGGFLYLQNEIQPTTGQMWVIFILTVLVCSGAWVWAAVHYDPSESRFVWRRR